LRELLERDVDKHAEILDVIKKFRDEELEHHDTGLEYDAAKVLFESLFNKKK
jgi:3-demethoxyubiquinol 3-hydroxylase